MRAIRSDYRVEDTPALRIQHREELACLGVPNACRHALAARAELGLTLRYPYEVRDEAEYFDDPRAKAAQGDACWSPRLASSRCTPSRAALCGCDRAGRFQTRLTEQFTGKFVERGPKKAPAPQGYAQFMGVFADFFLPKLTGKEFQKNRETGPNNRDSACYFVPLSYPYWFNPQR